MTAPSGRGYQRGLSFPPALLTRLIHAGCCRSALTRNLSEHHNRAATQAGVYRPAKNRPRSRSSCAGNSNKCPSIRPLSSVASAHEHMRKPRETSSASIARSCALIGRWIGESGRDSARDTASSLRASPSSLAESRPTSGVRIGAPDLLALGLLSEDCL